MDTPNEWFWILIGTLVVVAIAIGGQAYTKWSYERTIVQKIPVMKQKSRQWMIDALRPYTNNLPAPKNASSEKAEYERMITQIVERIAQTLPVQEFQSKCELSKDKELSVTEETTLFDRQNLYVNCLLNEMWRKDLPEWIDTKHIRLYVCPALLLCSFAIYITNYGNIYHFEECTTSAIEEGRCRVKGEFLRTPSTFLEYDEKKETVRIRIWVVGMQLNPVKQRTVSHLNGWFTLKPSVWQQSLEHFFLQNPDCLKEFQESIENQKAEGKETGDQQKTYTAAEAAEMLVKKLDRPSLDRKARDALDEKLVLNGVLRNITELPPEWSLPFTLNELRYLLYVFCENELKDFDWKYPHGLWNIKTSPTFESTS